MEIKSPIVKKRGYFKSCFELVVLAAVVVELLFAPDYKQRSMVDPYSQSFLYLASVGLSLFGDLYLSLVYHLYFVKPLMSLEMTRCFAVAYYLKRIYSTVGYCCHDENCFCSTVFVDCDGGDARMMILRSYRCFYRIVVYWMTQTQAYLNRCPFWTMLVGSDRRGVYFHLLLRRRHRLVFRHLGRDLLGDDSIVDLSILIRQLY